MFASLPADHSNCYIQGSNRCPPDDTGTLEGVEQVQTEDGEVAEFVDDVLIDRRYGLLVLMKDEPDDVADDHANQEGGKHQEIFHAC